MNALAAASPWYCVALRRASGWLSEAARRLEAPGIDGTHALTGDAVAHEYMHRCDVAEERLREMRMRYY